MRNLIAGMQSCVDGKIEGPEVGPARLGSSLDAGMED
jgi:hypothetical protein